MVNAALQWKVKDMKKNIIANIIKLIKETKNYSLIIIAIFTVVLAAITRQAVTYLLGDVVDIALNQSIEKTLKVFIFLIVGVIALLALDFVNSYFFGILANESLYKLRARTIKAVEGLSMTTISSYSTGDLISRMNNDLGMIDKFYRNIIQQTSYQVLIGLFAAVYGLFINYKVMLVLIIVSVITCILNYSLSKPIQKQQEELQELSGSISGAFQESINGHKEIKTFNLYNTFKLKFENMVNLYVKNFSGITRKECLWGAIEITAGIGMQIGTVFLCLIFVLRDEMTVGDIIVFQQIQEMLKNLFKIRFIDINKTIAASERIFELWDEEAEIMDGKQKHEDKNAPVISFKDVSFSYKSADNNGGIIDGKNVLNGISLEIGRNESVALVGPSGCGKTTVIKLICGYLKPDSGEVFYKGFLYDDWDKRVLRQGISLVDQDSYMFPVSIFDNIACGTYGQEENRSKMESQSLKGLVQQAAEQVSLSDFIDSLEKGYDTNVGEFGGRLSGGQKQRISIARAFVKDSDLLILDEPTSALDAQSEQEIQNAIERLMKNRTTVIVAHRLSTIKSVDRIVVLNNGQVVEEGNHESLVNKKGFYYKLYQQQFNNSLEAKHGE